MISDVLSDAAAQIRAYCNDDKYNDWMPRIEKVLAQMDELRALLDTPPGTNGWIDTKKYGVIKLISKTNGMKPMVLVESMPSGERFWIHENEAEGK